VTPSQERAVVGEKPVLLPLVPAAIPPELRNRPAWVGFRLERRDDGKWTKVPVNIRTGGRAATDSSETWVDFQTALNGHQLQGCDGVGLVRTGEFVFIDLDGCLDADGNLLPFPWAAKIIDALAGKAYIEKSISGSGIHVIAIMRGSLPIGRREFDEPNVPHTGCALYGDNRYFTMSGHKLPQSGPFRYVDSEMATLYVDLFPPKPNGNNGHNNGGSNGHSDRPGPSGPRPAPVSPGPSDAELIDRARHAKNGPEFSLLWDGDVTGYPSQSEADMALCCYLAFWTGKDASRMDSLFRQSGLYRDKWDRGTGDYADRTIAAAIELTTDVYDPGRLGEANYVVNDVYVVAPEGTGMATKSSTEGASVVAAVAAIARERGLVEGPDGVYRGMICPRCGTRNALVSLVDKSGRFRSLLPA